MTNIGGIFLLILNSSVALFLKTLVFSQPKKEDANHLILCTYSGTQYQLLAITDVVNINDNEESILDDDVYSSIMMMMLSMMM